MYAVVEIAGKQYQVTENTKLVTDKLAGEAGTTVEFDRVLLYVDGQNVKIGKPILAGAKVSATIGGNFKNPTVIVFKKKRRKNYRRTNGHRQQYTSLLINSISVG